MNILALDLGTKTGYAYGGRLVAGTWVLGSDREIKQWGKDRLTRRGDPRVCRLAARIGEVKASANIECVVFEDVEFATSRKQAHLWAALRSAIWLANCPDCGIIIEAVPVATLKKFATGSGAADKDAMQRALIKQTGLEHPSWDDNAVDAIWLWLWARENLSRIKP
jgi:Holliday junction resolvasome RuvABC endonuclease subunit